MARQIPSKSKHRIMPGTKQPARPSRTSNTRSITTTARSTRTSTTPIVSHGVQARDRQEHQEDNSAVESPPRVLSGSSQGSINTVNTSLESTPLVPIPRRMSTPVVSRVLEPLLRTPVDTANDSGSSVTVQLEAFFARQEDFTRRLEERLEEHLQGQGRENRPTAQATRFSKALSVSQLSSSIKLKVNEFFSFFPLVFLAGDKTVKVPVYNLHVRVVVPTPRGKTDQSPRVHSHHRPTILCLVLDYTVYTVDGCPSKQSLTTPCYYS